MRNNVTYVSILKEDLTFMTLFNNLIHSAFEAGSGDDSPMAKMSNPSPSGGIIVKTETTASDHLTLRTILSTSSSTGSGGPTTPITPKTPQVSSTISTPPGGTAEGKHHLCM